VQDCGLPGFRCRKRVQHVCFVKMRNVRFGPTVRRHSWVRRVRRCLRSGEVTMSHSGHGIDSDMQACRQEMKWEGVFFVKSGPFLDAGCITYSISIFYFTFYLFGRGGVRTPLPTGLDMSRDCIPGLLEYAVA